jgi:hypothetical protein
LLTPEENADLNAEGKVTFSWEPFTGASLYRLQITLPTNQVVIFDSEQTSRDLYLEALWLGGRYQWSVTAYDARGEVICSADPFSFEKPELIMPTPTVVQEEDEEPTSDGTGGEGTPSTASGSFSDISEA